MTMILRFDTVPNIDFIDGDKMGDIYEFSTDPIADEWPAQVRMQSLSKKKLPDYFPVGTLRLASRRFVDVCRDFKVNAEFLPVQILEKGDSKSQQAYYFCHVLDMVDCFDYKKGKIKYRDKKTDWIDKVTKFVIDEEKAAGHHLFRIDMSLFIIAASDEFAEAVQRLQLSGAAFTEPSEWRGICS
jgi:hypothetical protein